MNTTDDGLLPCEDELVAKVREALIEAAMTGGGSYRRDINYLVGNPTRLARAALAASDRDVLVKLVKAAMDVRDRFPPVYGCAETDEFPVEVKRIRALEAALRPFTSAALIGLAEEL